MTDETNTETAVTAEAPQESNLKGVFSYKRQVQVREYEPASAFLSVEFPIDYEDEAEDIIRKAQEAAALAKSVVLEQLGLPFTTDDDGIVMETVTRSTPSGPPVSYTQEQQPSGDGGSVAAQPPYNVATGDKSEKTANEAWAEQRYAQFPNEFWDNRSTKTNPRAPDAKHKQTGQPIWKL